MRNNLIIIVVMLLLFGCGSDGGISTTALTSVMNGSEAIGDDIVEASIAKELAVMNAWKKYYEVQKAIHAKSGITISFEMREVSPGIWIQQIKELAVRDHVTLQTPPEKPSEHPVWQFATHAVSVLAKYGLIGYGIHELNSMVSSGYSAAQGTTTTYSGPVTGSFNSVGGNSDMFIMRDSITTTTSGGGF
jgi:hypothetical protein